MNAQTKILGLFCGILFFAAPLLAGGPQQWAKAFSGDNVMKIRDNNFEFIMFRTCTVPGPKKVEQKVTVFEDFQETESTDEDALRGELEHLNETREYYLEMIKSTQAKLKDLGDGGDKGEKEFLLEDINVSQTMIKEINKNIEELESKIAGEEEPKEVAEKKEDDKKTDGEEGKKSEVAKEEKGKGGKPAGKAKGEKAGGPKKPVTHEEPTTNYYSIRSIMNSGDNALANMLNILGIELLWSLSPTKVYFVTSPQMWQSLKMPDRIVQPARNVCWDAKKRTMLLFASPAITNQLGYSFGYGVASMALELGLEKMNPGGELCNFIFDGLAGYASGLSAIVDINKVSSFGRLKERDLLVLAELLNPTRMKDNKRCYAFLTQGKAFAKYLSEHSRGNLRDYLKEVKGGNSGFRNSFQFLHISNHWGQDYDSFCNELPKRVFFPITQEAETDPNAMDEWSSSLDAQDKEQDEKKRLMKERKQIREIRRDVGDKYYRKYYKK